MRTPAMKTTAACSKVEVMIDALSELLSDVRIRDAVFVQTRLGGQGSLQVDDARQPCFHLVTQGRVWLHPPDGGAPMPLHAGDVAFVPRGQPHRLSAAPLPRLPSGRGVDLLARWRASPGEGVPQPPVQALEPADAVQGATLSGCMQIEGVTSAWLWGGLPPWLALQWGASGMPQWLVIGLAYLDQELSREGLARQAMIDRLGDILFIQSLRSYLKGDAGQAPPGWLLGLKDAMVSRVLGAIHRHPARSWPLSELAREGCVSRSVLAERFTRLLGVPPHGYLTQHRMQLAARRLARSEGTVGEVARSVGYRSSAAFAQAFKRTFGCSPREWRGTPPCR